MSSPRHLVSIADLDAAEIVKILDHGDRYWALAEEPIKKLVSLRGRSAQMTVCAIERAVDLPPIA